LFAQSTIVRRADFNADAGGERAIEAQARAKNFKDQGIAAADQFDAAAGTNAEHFQARGFFIIRIDFTDNAAQLRG
jgi:hypothetical protein